MVNRRSFVRLVGGGVVLAAGAALVGAYSLSSDIPAAAIEIWNGPGEETDVRKRAVAYAVTAPNPHNRQPWLVDLREPDSITLHCDRERLLPETDPFGRQILIGHGAFLELLVMALAEQGVHSEVTLWPEGEMAPRIEDWDTRPVARLRLRQGARADPLFASVLQRHTPKLPFDTARPVTAATLAALLLQPPGNDEVRVGGTVDPARVNQLRALCWEAAKVELTTPRTVMESIRLMRVGPDEILAHRDGLTINTRMARIASGLGQFDRSAPPSPDSPAHKQAMQTFDGYCSTAMGFIWLSTGGNSRSEQIAAGRAYVRQQLRATQLGIGVHPMSQALQEFAEMAPHYERAHRLLLGAAAPASARDATVQMLCRIGYAPTAVQASPRRPLPQFFQT
ncbi:Acg family FMN-binding oxidoreductase [Variovorax rhizosphaerae]|uniref:Twin-arginine translocation pathway signal protein n=1 Tax=Variovorax rhizosphaerae TaxID=1836200 RepID=A0ABU8WL96_9BURK